MVKPGDKIQLMSNAGKTFDVTEVGIFTLKQLTISLQPGDVGNIAASIKTVRIPVWGYSDLATNPASESLHGYRQMNQ